MGEEGGPDGAESPVDTGSPDLAKRPGFPTCGITDPQSSNVRAELGKRPDPSDPQGLNRAPHPPGNPGDAAPTGGSWSAGREQSPKGGPDFLFSSSVF